MALGKEKRGFAIFLEKRISPRSRQMYKNVSFRFVKLLINFSQDAILFNIIVRYKVLNWSKVKKKKSFIIIVTSISTPHLLKCHSGLRFEEKFVEHSN